MIVPSVSGIGSLGELATSQLTGAQSAGSQPVGGQGGAATGLQGAGQLEGVGQSTGATPASATLNGPAGTGPSGGFGGALENAISSLEQTQLGADSAAQSLATGTASDPESVVLTVQDAEMQMQLASQIRTKADEALQSIFQTQV